MGHQRGYTMTVEVKSNNEEFRDLAENFGFEVESTPDENPWCYLRDTTVHQQKSC